MTQTRDPWAEGFPCRTVIRWPRIEKVRALVSERQWNPEAQRWETRTREVAP